MGFARQQLYEWTPAVLSAGSNLGDRQEAIRKAVGLLKRNEHIRNLRISPLYRTMPIGGPDQDDFINACMTFETTLDARALLTLCHCIEQDMGRVRTVRWGPRELDLDIIFFGGLTVEEPDLAVPHPRYHTRGFVLVPLADLFADRQFQGFDFSEAYAAADKSGIFALNE